MQPADRALLKFVENYAAFRRLSPRQARIVLENMRGRHDKEIAFEFGCKESTIYEHWRRMAEKCGARFKSEVISDFHAFVWSASHDIETHREHGPRPGLSLADAANSSGAPRRSLS